MRSPAAQIRGLELRRCAIDDDGAVVGEVDARRGAAQLGGARPPAHGHQHPVEGHRRAVGEQQSPLPAVVRPTLVTGCPRQHPDPVAPQGLGDERGGVGVLLAEQPVGAPPPG